MAPHPTPWLKLASEEAVIELTKNTIAFKAPEIFITTTDGGVSLLWILGQLILFIYEIAVGILTALFNLIVIIIQLIPLLVQFLWACLIDIISGLWYIFCSLVTFLFHCFCALLSWVWALVCSVASQIWSAICNFSAFLWAWFVKIVLFLPLYIGRVFKEAWHSGVWETVVVVLIAMSAIVGVIVGIAALFSVLGRPRESQEDQRERGIRELNGRQARFTRQTGARPPTQNTPFLSNQTRSQGYQTTTTSLTCMVCGDDIPAWTTSALGQTALNQPLNRAPTCRHDWCWECLQSLFQRTLKDQSLWPPSCCDNKTGFPELQLIALNVLSPGDYRIFLAKTVEYEDKDPLYCPLAKCGAFIPVRKFQYGGLGAIGSSSTAVLGNALARCTKCGTNACVKCKSAWHGSQPCKKDPGLAAVEALAEKEMWAKCPECKEIIELAQGCNHMTCRCKKEFCYVCKRNWRGADGRQACNCLPWSEVKRARVSAQTYTPTAAPAPVIAPVRYTGTLATNNSHERAAIQRREELLRREREETLRREMSARIAAEREQRDRRERAEREERANRLREQRINLEREQREEREARERLERQQRERIVRLDRERRENLERDERERAIKKTRERLDAIIERHQRQAREAREDQFLPSMSNQQEINSREAISETSLRMHSTKRAQKPNSHNTFTSCTHNGVLGLPASTRQSPNTRLPEIKRVKQYTFPPYGELPPPPAVAALISSTCRHSGSWDQIQGVHRCSECNQYLGKFILQCPGCEIRTCVACKKELRIRMNNGGPGKGKGKGRAGGYL